jgi:hypothetical protein
MERLGATNAWDFVNQSYLRAGRVTSAPGLTVTRASSGYAETSDGRLVEFGSGVLRRTDRGVLVEGARTNLLVQSQTFDNAAWVKSNATVTANAGTAPDGTTTADQVTTTNANGYIIPSSSLFAAAGGATFVYSVFAKAGTATTITLLLGATANYVGTFNLSTGVASTSSANTTVSMTDAGSGWYRCVLTCAAVANIGYAEAQIGRVASGLTFSLWGAQLEAAAFASSYIKTEGSTVTRAADEVTASLTGVAYPLSLYTEFVRNGDTGAAEGVFQVDASSRAQRANINVSSSDTLSVTARGGTNDGDAAVTGAISVGAITKGAGRIEVDNVQAARAGSLATADTTVSVPTSSPDTVRFGDIGDTPNYGFFYLRTAAIIPRALTDAQLQGLTT